RALPTFISQALKGEDLTVFGSGEQTRSFCYVSDMVEGLYKLLLSKEHEPVNLGNPEEVSILQLAREVAELASSKSKLIFEPLPEDDPKVRKPDISRAKRLLNWEPEVGRREGLLETIEHFSRKLRGQGVGVRE
ncbi:MAG: GDP-mannose 4,6-dehydratase, partial [Planctomycetes bacterium]|nr:GDP-mannose 4,6-dehydratase [Planctomycetota bacterium]